MIGGDNLSNVVEAARACYGLMPGRTVSMLFGPELRLLQFRIRLHSSIATALHEFKHGSFLLPYKK